MLIQELIDIRRELHQIPEISGEEYKTAEYIRNRLTEYGITYYSVAETGTVAIINGKNANKTVLLRADIDALPIVEDNDLPFKSKNHGLMHACGHDIHTACLLYAAKVLNENRDSLNGNVKLVFQPREETDGGAEKMIKEGIMNNPDVNGCFAFHVDPLLDYGTIGVKDGAIMASPDDFELEITGKSGHGAEPEKCINPINCAIDIINHFNSISSRTISAQNPTVITICSINAGNCSNVIPENVKILGTARTLDETTRLSIEMQLKDIVASICNLHKATYDFKYNRRFPPLINDNFMNNIVVSASKKINEISKIHYYPKASMCGDDFSYFSQLVPSAYFKIGVGNDNCHYPIHNSHFIADENALTIGYRMFVECVNEFLNE